MTPDQFETIQKLIRGKPNSAGNEAARLVLVEGISLTEAAAQAGTTYTGAWNATKRYEDAYTLITTHFGGETPRGNGSGE